MSRVVLVAASLFLTAYSLRAQQADYWEWMNPKPTGNTIHALHFVHDNLGYAVGEYGTILRTTDQGASWQQMNSGSTQQLLSVHFVDANVGYVGGPNQLLRRTTDGGHSWTNVRLPIQGQLDTLFYVRDIDFVTSQIGFVTGFFLMESKIWKTTDGGTSWETQTTGGANYLRRSFFSDANTGWAVGGALGSEIVRTTNGGADWQLVESYNFSALLDICFLSPTLGFAAGENGVVLRSTDSGATWHQVGSPSSLDITALVFLNQQTGFGFGTGSVYIKTVDGGATWTEHSLGVQSSRAYYSAQVTPDGSIHAAGSYGAMIRSTNGGASFISQPFVSEGYISDIEFVNTTTGYAVAGYSGGDILKTTDAGRTWVSQITSYIPPLYGIAFTTEQTGFLAGSTAIYKTTNGGNSWSTIYTTPTNEIYTDVFFTSASTGYVVGSYGRLLKTSNAGANWTPTTVPSSGMLSSIYFTNANTGFVVGDNNVAMKTIDGGTTWTPMVVASGFVNHNTIFFTDNMTGYISSTTGIYKTTDAGVNWFSAGAPTGGYSNVQFRGPYGYAITSGGKIIKSTDAGASWIVQPTVTNNGLYGLYFNSDNFVYAGGLLGTMIKTVPTELRLTTVEQSEIHVPQTIALHQNYPNPFNPTTNIEFTIPAPSRVALKIYDVLGREVAVVFDGNLSAGHHHATWNAAGKPSGVYFYRLQAGEFSATRRMLLVK